MREKEHQPNSNSNGENPKKKVFHLPVVKEHIQSGYHLMNWIKEEGLVPIVVDPHCDDSHYSIGETLYQLCAASRAVRHLVVFSQGSETQESKAYYEKRKQEVSRANSLIGIPEERTAFLDEVDFPDRHPQLWQPVKYQAVKLGFGLFPANLKLLERVATRVVSVASEYPRPLLIVPIAGLRHRDHYLTRAAMEEAQKRLSQKGAAHLIYYDEYPYNIQISRLNIRLSGPDPGVIYLQGTHTAQVLGAENQRRRRALMEVFETQTQVMFGGTIPPQLPPEQLFIPHRTYKEIIMR
jgi:LmbE family N-acetylglucosaminyl deacetylase